MQEIQFVKQIIMLNKRGAISIHHRLILQLQLMALYRLLQRRLSYHNQCGTKTLLTQIMNKRN